MPIAVDDVVRLDALVHVVVGAVLDEGEPLVAGDREGRAPRGRQRHHHTAAAAGDSAQQRHPAVSLEGPGHEVGAGEGLRGDQAVEVQVGDGVLVVELMVQVHIRAVNGGALRAGERGLDRDLSVAQEPAERVDRSRRRAAGVAAQVEHDVLDGAVLAGDLPVRLDDQADGVVAAGAP